MRCIICTLLFSYSSITLFATNNILKEKALRGNVESQLRLGFSYVNKSPANWSQALFWFDMAADRENAKACFWLGYAYQNGLGTIESPQKAIFYYQRGASLGSMECAKSLAILFNKLSDHIEANAWKSIYFEKTTQNKTDVKLTKIKKLSALDRKYAMALANEIMQSWKTKPESPIWDPMTKPPRFGRKHLNDSVYNGILYKDQPNGYGTLKSVGGEIYYGYFKNGQKHGYGTLYKKDGEVVFDGSWFNNIPAKPSK